MSRPQCPHHPGTRMRLVPQAEPLFAMTTAKWSSDKRMEKHRAKRDTRLIYRCGIKTCPRVEPHWTWTVEKHLCRVPRCQKLAHPERAERGDYICKEHDAERRKKNDTKRRGTNCKFCGGKVDPRRIARFDFVCPECSKDRGRKWRAANLGTGNA